jgi:hypothetical protein
MRQAKFRLDGSNRIMKSMYWHLLSMVALLACAGGLVSGCGESRTPAEHAALPATAEPSTASEPSTTVGPSSLDESSEVGQPAELGDASAESRPLSAAMEDAAAPLEPSAAGRAQADSAVQQATVQQASALEAEPAAAPAKSKAVARGGKAARVETVARGEAAARGESGPAPSSGGSYDQAKRPKFDPIEVNGKYFTGWPKPKLALVISGRQDGYLEPCGCAGIDQQKGGVSRRDSFLRGLEKQGWPVLAIDVGSMVRSFGRQAEIKFAISAEALKKMKYAAAGFGPDDLRLSAGEIVAAVAGEDPADGIFVSANVNLFDLIPKSRIIEAGGMKIGITSVLGDEYQREINNGEITFTPAAEALDKVVAELADCDHRVLLAHATVAETEALARKFPQFDVVVTSDGRDVPPQQPEKIEGTQTRLIEVAPKAMYVIVAGFYDDPKQPVRYQRVALDSRYGESAAMKALMTTYQDQLRELGWRDLGIKGSPHPSARGNNNELAGKFVGAQSCKECHPTAYGIWSKSPHAHATETLTKLDPPRQFDAEWISWHATGWNPQEYVPFSTGFESLEATPQLAGNQCENCHGPAAAHVAAEQGRNRIKRDAERKALQLTAGFAQENVCVKCHDHDNSPEFNAESFAKHYWPKVEHKGKR